VRGAAIAAPALCLAAACANVGERVREDRAAVEELLAPELAEALPAGPGDEAEVGASVALLLEGGVDEAEAVKLAVLNNGRVRARLAELGVASAEVVQAGLVRNPVFVLEAKFYDGGTQLEAGLSQSFVDLFLVSSRRRTAEGEMEAVRARIAGELTQLAYDVRRAFVHAHAARAAVEIERARLAAAGSSQELMAQLRAAGNVTAARAAAEDLERARAHADLARALDRARESRESLSAWMGLSGSDLAWQLAGELATPPPASWPEDVEAAALEASLDLRAGRSQARAAAQRADYADVEAALDTATLGLVAEREAESGDWGLGPSLGLSVPIFDTGAARASAAELELAGVLARQAQLAVEVRSAARRLIERERSLGAQLEHLAQVERPAAEAYLQAVLQEYNSMQIGAFDVLLARQRELDSERAWVETLERAWRARLDLRELLDGVLREQAEDDHARDMPARTRRGRPGGGH
jgi:cobalt-zinc-cadmium efflux system outer membrane protein